MKKLKKNAKKLDIQSYFLEKELTKEKEHLQELKRTANKVNKQEEMVVKIIDTIGIKARLKEYGEKLSQYGEKLNKLYSQSITEELQKELTESGIDAQTFEEYMELKKV